MSLGSAWLNKGKGTHTHRTNTKGVTSFTFVVGGEAEHVVVVLVLVSQAIVADTGHRVLASTGLSGVGDGILHRAVTQPAGIAPVHISSPGVIQLVK